MRASVNLDRFGGLFSAGAGTVDDDVTSFRIFPLLTRFVSTM